MSQFESSRTRYDSLALTLAIVPLLIFYFTIFTAPAALFIAIRYWNAPPSIVGRLGTRVRLIIAIVAATLEIVMWVVLFSMMFASGF